MPVTKKGSKWAIGPNAPAIHKTKKDAQNALKAYHASKGSKK